VMLQGTNGLAKRVVEQKYPNLPPQVGCAVMYWLDAPAVARQMETPEHANTPPQPPMLQDEERRTALQREQEEAVERVRQQECKDLARIRQTCLNAVPAQPSAPSYKPPDRRDMDRLIENAR